MDDHDSEDLIRRATNGDSQAVEDLILRHLAGLRVFVRARVDPVLGEQESSLDLVQTVCREAIEKLDKYE